MAGRILNMAQVHLIDHPLVQHQLTILRDKETPPEQFRPLVKELSLLLAYEAARNLPTTETELETPVGPTRGVRLAGPVCLVPILRAGLAMADGILRLFPNARVGHIGLYRDPDTTQPVTYYNSFPPDVKNLPILVLDPMLATGGSAVAGVRMVKEAGGQAISFLALVAAPEGIAAFHRAHPDVPVYTAAVDQGLNDKAYIVPGLGDAGDRLY